MDENRAFDGFDNILDFHDFTLLKMTFMFLPMFYKSDDLLKPPCTLQDVHEIRDVKRESLTIFWRTPNPYIYFCRSLSQLPS